MFSRTSFRQGALFRLVGKAVLVVASWPVAGAQPGTKLVEPPAPLLPARLADFTKSTPAPVGDGLGQIDPALAAVLKEDGLRRFERSTYASGGNHGTLTAYQFVDASGAYAFFCFNRRPGAAAAAKRVGDATISTPDGVILQSGINLVVATFDVPIGRTTSFLADLILHLPKAAGPAGQPPLLPSYLPPQGLLSGSVHYALGPTAYAAGGGVLSADILAFDKSAEAVTAEYTAHGGHGAKGVLTLLLYPTPTIAGDEGRAIESQVHTLQANAGHTGFATAKLRREGPMLMLATGAFSDAEAQRLIDGIHLRNELTWNKQMPVEFHSEVKKTASLLTSILVFSGVGAAAAIMLGLFLGFGRAGIRVLMGKPAASEPEFLRIDLSGKPSHDLRGPLGSEGAGTPGV